MSQKTEYYLDVYWHCPLLLGLLPTFGDVQAASHLFPHMRGDVSHKSCYFAPHHGGPRQKAINGLEADLHLLRDVSWHSSSSVPGGNNPVFLKKEGAMEKGKRRSSRKWLHKLEGKEVSLRRYQEDDVQQIRKMNLRCFINHPEGLGKSVDAVCAVFSRGRHGYPALVVCSKSEKDAWRLEIERWTDARCVVINGRAKVGVKFRAKDSEFFVINYDVLDSWKSLLTGFRTIIFDDCEKLHNGVRARASREIAKDVSQIIAISDESVYSDPTRFFDVFRLLYPKAFTSYYWFANDVAYKVRNKYIVPSGYYYGSCKDDEALWDWIGSFTLRRTRASVQDQIPA